MRCHRGSVASIPAKASVVNEIVTMRSMWMATAPRSIGGAYTLEQCSGPKSATATRSTRSIMKPPETPALVRDMRHHDT